jgi:hypothetical protein
MMRTTGWMTRTNAGVLAVAAIVASREVLVHSARIALAPRRPAAVVAPFSCDAVSARDVIAPTARIDSGEYTFTLVATAGPSSGASVRGRLWLRRSSTLDTSALASVRALAADTARIPLYGAANVDFSGVGIAIGSSASNGAADPRSFDPMRPGALVTHHTSRATGEGRWRLLIGTTANDRHAPCDTAGECPPPPAAGPGVVLSVSKIVREQFAGGWTAVGGEDGARGYFCAVPVHYFGFPYPQRRHIP